MKRTYIFYLSFFVNVLFLGILLYYFLGADNKTTTEPVDLDFHEAKNVDLISVLKSVPYDSISKQLAVNDYHHASNIHDFKTIENDLKTLDSLYPNHKFDLRVIMGSLLTDTLHNSIRNNFSGFNFEELLWLQNLQVRYSYYSQCSFTEENNLMFSVIANYWGIFVAGNLSEVSKQKNGVKFDFGYRYLESRSDQYRYSVNTKVWSLEKFIYNLLTSNWGHLINASWAQASILQKFIFILLSLITLLSYFLLFNELKRKIYRYNKN